MALALQAAADQQVSLTDPDARSRATSGCGTGWSTRHRVSFLGKGWYQACKYLKVLGIVEGFEGVSQKRVEKAGARWELGRD
jgi:hypothetical protein